MTFLLAMLMMMWGVSSPAWADDAPSPREALQQAMREMTAEAREAKKSLSLPRVNADFAAGFPHEVDVRQIEAKFIRPVDRDPFVDAYVRWQMTSFLDGLPVMDDRAFERFLEDLPACLQNPEVDPAFVQPFMKAGAGVELAESDQKHVAALIEKFNVHREQTGAMRRPAEALRQWISEHVGDDGQRPLQASFERLVATATAGWRVDREKLGFEELCERARRDRSFKEEQRERLAKQIEGLPEISHVAITRAEQNEDGSLRTSISDVSVLDFETRRWAKIIRRD